MISIAFGALYPRFYFFPSLPLHATRFGSEVVALVRRPEAVPLHDRLTVVGGDVRDDAALDKLLPGAALVLSCLGNRRGEPKVNQKAPWRNPPSFLVPPDTKIGDLRKELLISSAYVPSFRSMIIFRLQLNSTE